METNKILSADLLDLVFDDRNKDYGAYELRRTYDKRIKQSLIITGTLILLVISGTLLANQKESKREDNVKTTEITLIDHPDDEPPPPPPPPDVPPPAQEPVRTERLTNIVIKPDVDVDQIMAPVEEFTRAQIGTEPLAGIEGPDIEMPPDGPGGPGIIPPPPPPESFTPIEIEASYEGDWRRFLENTLRGDVPVDNGAPAGQYTVIIQFSIDKEGNITDFKPLTNLGYGMEQEAIRALKKSKKWKPSFQNGKWVPNYRRQPITFKVNNE